MHFDAREQKVGFGTKMQQDEKLLSSIAIHF
jgi:hypothetical protein